MSLVGTRPPTLDEWEKYEPHHRARMSFRPGLTGLWQVSGRSNITDFEEVVKLDTQYIGEWSVKNDLRIIFQTAISIMKKDGAMQVFELYFTWQSAILVLSIADYFLEAFMANTLKLLVGIENFEEIRKLGFYYIDKTRLIEQLLQGWVKVTLFTRPRRFGKTLNMSMLKSFFEIGTD